MPDHKQLPRCLACICQVFRIGRVSHVFDNIRFRLALKSPVTTTGKLHHFQLIYFIQHKVLYPTTCSNTYMVQIGCSMQKTPCRSLSCSFAHEAIRSTSSIPTLGTSNLRSRSARNNRNQQVETFFLIPECTIFTFSFPSSTYTDDSVFGNRCLRSSTDYESTSCVPNISTS